jgi:hypothetical protein
MSSGKDSSIKTHKHRRARGFDLLRFANIRFDEETKRLMKLVKKFGEFARLAPSRLPTDEKSSQALIKKLRDQHNALRLSVACLSSYAALVPPTRKTRLSYRRRHSITDTMDRKSRLAYIRERRFQLRAKLGIETRD